MTETMARHSPAGLGQKAPAGTAPRRAARVLVTVLLALLVLPLLFGATSAFAADGDDEEASNYSLYKLASNTATFFDTENSPEGKGDLAKNWGSITDSAADGGSMIGYADPELSAGNVVGWVFNELSGSSGSVRYDTFYTPAEVNSDANYSGMLDYSQFGAANHSLGLDTMSGGGAGSFVAPLAGGIIWVLYALALGVNMIFWVIIQFLQIINPFGWFYTGVMSLGDGSGDSIAQQQEKALGMVGGNPGTSTMTSQIQTWVGSWYKLLVDMAWQLTVPLFIAVLLFSVVLLKKGNRGSMFKKLVVRLLFIGFGLPLIGSLYTAVLDQFDDKMFSEYSGPSRVVLSTYVDFEGWVMNNRMAIPEQADITWDGSSAGSSSMMKSRTSALAINTSSNPAFGDIRVGDSGTSAESAWNEGTSNYGAVAAEGTEEASDASSVLKVFSLLMDYIGKTEVTAADFESGIKTNITNIDSSLLDDGDDTKKKWFTDEGDYADVSKMGGAQHPSPNEHPVISVAAGEGLQAKTREQSDGNVREFTTTEQARRSCGFEVINENGDAAACNLSPLATYNYLNTSFGPDALTTYSSNKATSGFTRESHMAVSQVGTGPVKLTFWLNTAVILGVIVMLGIAYGLGMLFGSIKHTGSVLAAIPFATLGALGSIAKVLIHSAALVLQILVTLFLYQFVSEILVVLPSLIEGPMSSFLGSGFLLGNQTMGTIAIVVLTLFSTMIILGVGMALMRVRSSVMQALDEQVTKLVNRFLETEAGPSGAGQPGGGLGGMPAAVGGGLGTAAGAAAGARMSAGRNGGSGTTGSTTGTTGGSNAGGLNGGGRAGTGGGGRSGARGAAGGLAAGGAAGLLTGSRGASGGSGNSGDPGSAAGPEGGLPGGSGGSGGGSAAADRSTADQLQSQGGLTNYGFGPDHVGADTGSAADGTAGGANGTSGSSITGQTGAAGMGPAGASGASGELEAGRGADGAEGTSGAGGAGGTDGASESAEQGTGMTGAPGQQVDGPQGSVGLGRDGANAELAGQQQPGAPGAAGTDGASEATAGGVGQTTSTHGETPGANSEPAGQSQASQSGRFSVDGAGQPVGQEGSAATGGAGTGAAATAETASARATGSGRDGAVSPTAQTGAAGLGAGTAAAGTAGAAAGTAAGAASSAAARVPQAGRNAARAAGAAGTAAAAGTTATAARAAGAVASGGTTTAPGGQSGARTSSSGSSAAPRQAPVATGGTGRTGTTSGAARPAGRSTGSTAAGATSSTTRQAQASTQRPSTQRSAPASQQASTRRTAAPVVSQQTARPQAAKPAAQRSASAATPAAPKPQSAQRPSAPKPQSAQRPQSQARAAAAPRPQAQPRAQAPKPVTPKPQQSQRPSAPKPQQAPKPVAQRPAPAAQPQRPARPASQAPRPSAERPAEPKKPGRFRKGDGPGKGRMRRR